VTGSIQESPTGWQGEILECARATLSQVGNVERLKEFWSVRELRSAPDGPTTRFSVDKVPQAIQRLKMKSIKRDAELLISCR
jgi:hypothetical protein